MRIIDLRSDTVTLPTPAMRRAMYEAEVGDDVYGEDPTVRRLELLAAEMLGKEAGLFVVSGTMGNLVSLLTHCGRGDEIIMGDQSHTFFYEQGGVSSLGGVHTYPVRNLPDGMLDPEQVENAIRADNIHFPRTRVISVENTHNRCGGTALKPAQMAQLRQIADAHNLMIHLDGARIFNAAIALDLPAQDLVADADSVQICLSKGLAAPVGSVICGTREFIEEAKRLRKVVGGGMRQAGVIAAAGIVALQEMVDRLADDHENAKRLAEGLAEIKGYRIDPQRVQTNIIMFGLENPHISLGKVVEGWASKGVKINQISATQFRAVTHYGIEREDIDEALRVAQQVIQELS